MQGFQRYLGLSLLLLCSACAFFKPADHFESRSIQYEELKGWREDAHGQALEAFLATCPNLELKAHASSSGSGLRMDRQLWRSLCNDARRIPPGNNELARQFFETRFVPYRISNNGRENGLFTGYYEPLLFGSTRKQGDFIYPLYVSPPDLGRRSPYFTHHEINSGALDRKGLELVWVDDPVMRYFLQIQGSGRVRLDGGKEMLVGYAGKNGHPYVALGKVMADEGLIPKDQINFFSLRQWLYDHHDQAWAMMERNPSYVFFRKLDQGPVGAAGAVLTKQRSLAVDSHYIPYGLPLFLETAIPGLPGRQDTSFCRLLVAQDTGGAIRGPVRGDIFFGHGSEAEYLAGYMKNRGSYSLLVPREIVSQLQ